VSASQFVIEHIISVLGGGGVLITGLATYLGKFWADKSLLQEKSKLEGDIKLLEKDLQLELTKRDQYHQISKPTFEKLFDKKIKIYTRLLTICLAYKKFSCESGFNKIFDYQFDSALEYVNLMKKEIEDNRLYVSEALVKKFNSWYLKASEYYRDLEIKEIEVQQNVGLDGEYIHEKVSKAQEETIRQMLTKTDTELNEVFLQIEVDASEFRKRMHII